MVNNIELIKTLLHFDSEDDFYHLQIIKRKKENEDLNSNSYVVKTYYIRNLEYFEKKRPEIIALCDFHNARACINLNRRSFKKIAFHALKKISDQILAEDYKSVRKAYESVCGTYGNEANQRWIIDIDDISWNSQMLKQIQEKINTVKPLNPPDKLVAVIPTKNGVHMIVTPFDRMSLQIEHGIHKNNPTLLYTP